MTVYLSLGMRWKLRKSGAGEETRAICDFQRCRQIPAEILQSLSRPKQMVSAMMGYGSQERISWEKGSEKPQINKKCFFPWSESQRTRYYAIWHLTWWVFCWMCVCVCLYFPHNNESAFNEKHNAVKCNGYQNLKHLFCCNIHCPKDFSLRKKRKERFKNRWNIIVVVFLLRRKRLEKLFIAYFIILRKFKNICLK